MFTLRYSTRVTQSPPSPALFTRRERICGPRRSELPFLPRTPWLSTLNLGGGAGVGGAAGGPTATAAAGRGCAPWDSGCRPGLSAPGRSSAGIFAFLLVGPHLVWAQRGGRRRPPRTPHSLTVLLGREPRVGTSLPAGTRPPAHFAECRDPHPESRRSQRGSGFQPGTRGSEGPRLTGTRCPGSEQGRVGWTGLPRGWGLGC